MGEGWRIAILGATGSVGEALIDLLQEREFPIGELYLLASERSAGTSIRFNGKTIVVQDAEKFDWSEVQLAFFVGGVEAAKTYAENVANAGCLVIDLSGLFALEFDIPLIVPDVNSDVLSDYRNRNIIAIADSLTCQLLTAIKPLIDLAGVSRLQVTSLISASSLGKSAVDELARQSTRLLNGLPIEEGEFFQKQLAFNLLPLIADHQGSVKEERNLVEQVRKVLQDSGLPIGVTCIQSPVFYGNVQIVNFEGIRAISMQDAQTALTDVEDIQLSEDDDYPTPVSDASGNSHLSIGCLRHDYGIDEVLQFWSVADNVRFSAALMAIKTAELLIKEYL